MEKGKPDFNMEGALDFLVTGNHEKKKQQPTPKKKYITVTVRIEENLLSKVKALAYWQRKKIQDIYNTALSNYVSKLDEKELIQAVEQYQKYLED